MFWPSGLGVSDDGGRVFGRYGRIDVVFSHAAHIGFRNGKATSDKDIPFLLTPPALTDDYEMSVGVVSPTT
jgi:hypothetical protein